MCSPDPAAPPQKRHRRDVTSGAVIGKGVHARAWSPRYGEGMHLQIWGFDRHCDLEAVQLCQDLDIALMVLDRDDTPSLPAPTSRPPGEPPGSPAPSRRVPLLSPTGASVLPAPCVGGGRRHGSPRGRILIWKERLTGVNSYRAGDKQRVPPGRRSRSVTPLFFTPRVVARRPLQVRGSRSGPSKI